MAWDWFEGGFWFGVGKRNGRLEKATRNKVGMNISEGPAQQGFLRKPSKYISGPGVIQGVLW